MPMLSVENDLGSISKGDASDGRALSTRGCPGRKGHRLNGLKRVEAVLRICNDGAARRNTVGTLRCPALGPLSLRRRRMHTPKEEALTKRPMNSRLRAGGRITVAAETNI